MPETSLSDEVRPSEVPEAPPTPTGPTPMSQFAGRITSSDLLPAFLHAGGREVGALRTSAAHRRSDATDLKALTDLQAAERTAARPTVPTLPTPPDTTPKPFLSPSPGMLAQLQSAITGATEMVVGVGGLKGGGYAIAAVSGLKGALEGWAAGDRERAEASFRDWKANVAKLDQDYQHRLESYRTLLTDQHRSIEARLAQIGIQARSDGDLTAAGAAERGNLGQLLDLVSSREVSAATFAQHAKKLDVEEAHWRAQAAKADRDYAEKVAAHRDLQRQRDISNARAATAGARAERGMTLREETSRAVVTLQGQETALAQKLENAGVVREAVDLLDKEGILPKGATVWDKGKAAIALQAKPGRGDIAQAVQVVQRLGTPLVIGTEVGLGTTGSALRLKVVGEAEAGNLLGAPKQFWDLFLPMAEKKWSADRAIARQHLERLGRLPPDAAEPEILWKDE